MRWVTWSNVGIDRIGSAWLIRNYIDKDAEFVFVNYGEDVPEDAGEEVGIPFDVGGKRYSHHRGHCTFQALLKEFGLHDPILEEIGNIINGVDSPNQIIVPEESKGVEAICVGLRAFLGDDRAAIEQGKFIYDALYAYLQKEKYFEK